MNDEWMDGQMADPKIYASRRLLLAAEANNN